MPRQRFRNTLSSSGLSSPTASALQPFFFSDFSPVRATVVDVATGPRGLVHPGRGRGSRGVLGLGAAGEAGRGGERSFYPPHRTLLLLLLLRLPSPTTAKLRYAGGESPASKLRTMAADESRRGWMPLFPLHESRGCVV